MNSPDSLTYARSQPTPASVALDGSIAWYCLRTRRKRESFAARQLRERTGLEVFAPRLLIQRAGSRSEQPTSEPLFPGYLFCRLSLGLHLRHALSTPDITGDVRFGDRMPHVPEDMIEFLRRQTATPHVMEPLLKVGDWVRVLEGTFVGQEGRVLSFHSARDRAWILLSLLGSEVRVCIPLDAIAPENEVPTVPPLLARDP